MTERWVVLTPPGVEVIVREAAVTEPTLSRADQLPALLKREAALRALREAEAELGIAQPPSGESEREPAAPSERPVGEWVDPEAGEMHRTYKRVDPVFMCRCNQGFGSQDALRRHQRACEVFQAWKLPGGTELGEPGALRWPGERSG